MPHRSILCAASATDEDVHVFHCAAQLAAAQGGRLRVLAAFPPAAVQLSYVSPPGFYIDPQLLADVQASNEAARTLVHERAREAAEQAGLAFGDQATVEDEDRSLLDALLSRLPLTDLLAVGPSAATQEYVAQALLQADAPVLVIREGLCLRPATIAVAWDGGPNAGRALRAAMPLFPQARRIVVLQQAECLSAERRRAADPISLIDYLRLHGFEAEFQPIEGHADTGEAILQAARGCDADLLVCGAYGHSRMAEFVFGGVTRKVLGAAWPSVLLAH